MRNNRVTTSMCGGSIYGLVERPSFVSVGLSGLSSTLLTASPTEMVLGKPSGQTLSRSSHQWSPSSFPQLVQGNSEILSGPHYGSEGHQNSKAGEPSEFIRGWKWTASQEGGRDAHRQGYSQALPSVRFHQVMGETAEAVRTAVPMSFLGSRPHASFPPISSRVTWDPGGAAKCLFGLPL